MGVDIVACLASALPRAPPLPLDVVDILCCVARGIPFTPPVKFVLMALQQLLFFYQSEKVSISISTMSTILTAYRVVILDSVGVGKARCFAMMLP